MARESQRPLKNENIGRNFNILSGATVNLHITGKCNLKCDYCFAVYKGIPDLTVNVWKNIISKLQKGEAGKLNFSGGEPLMYCGIEELLGYSKQLNLRTSIVTNGILLSDDWLREHLPKIDIIGFSLDSQDERIQQSLNRGAGTYVADTEEAIKRVRYWSDKLQSPTFLKLNIVVTKLNKKEDPSPLLSRLNPDRIKLLQFCAIEGENDEYARRLSITREEFQAYVHRIQKKSSFLGKTIMAESEEMLCSSYLILDPQGRFCDKREGKNRFGRPLAKTTLIEALCSLYSSSDIETIFNKMKERGGFYDL